MTITLQVDRTKNLTICTLTGELTLDKIYHSIKSYWEARELTMNALWDTRDTQLANLKSSEVERVTSFIRQFRPRFEERKGGKTAVVASSDLQYGLSRIVGTLYEIENFPTQLKVFRTMDEAKGWLDQEE
jgi:hypothetical protein